jgi:hypothetical protein
LCSKTGCPHLIDDVAPGAASCTRSISRCTAAACQPLTFAFNHSAIGIPLRGDSFGVARAAVFFALPFAGACCGGSGFAAFFDAGFVAFFAAGFADAAGFGAAAFFAAAFGAAAGFAAGFGAAAFFAAAFGAAAFFAAAFGAAVVFGAAAFFGVAFGAAVFAGAFAGAAAVLVAFFFESDVFFVKYEVAMAGA